MWFCNFSNGVRKIAVSENSRFSARKNVILHRGVVWVLLWMFVDEIFLISWYSKLTENYNRELANRKWKYVQIVAMISIFHSGNMYFPIWYVLYEKFLRIQYYFSSSIYWKCYNAFQYILRYQSFFWISFYRKWWNITIFQRFDFTNESYKLIHWV